MQYIHCTAIIIKALDNSPATMCVKHLPTFQGTKWSILAASQMLNAGLPTAE
jgi:hypothetical protein